MRLRNHIKISVEHWALRIPGKFMKCDVFKELTNAKFCIRERFDPEIDDKQHINIHNKIYFVAFLFIFIYTQFEVT